MTNPLNEDLVVWLDRIRLSTPWALHARLSDVEAALVRIEMKIDSLEERMTEADSHWQEVANMIGLVAAELASIREQNAEGTAAAVDAVKAEHLTADIARADGLVASLRELITTSPDIPAEVPDVPVPEPGEPAVNPDDPHPDQTLPGDLPPE